MFRRLTGLGMSVVIGLAAISIVANFWFGTLLTTGDERYFYGALFALLDGLKTLLLPIAAVAALASLRVKSWSAVLVFAMLSALSFTAEVGLYATTKSETIGDAKAAHETYSQAKEAKERADAALALFGPVRPLGDIGADLATFKRDRLYDRSVQCTDATALDSRDLCARIDRLKGEQQTALEYAAARQAAQAAAVHLSKQNVAAAMRVIDPQAEALAKLLSPLVAVDADAVRTGLAVFIAVLIELGSGLGPWLVMPAPRAAGSKPSAAAAAEPQDIESPKLSAEAPPRRTIFAAARAKISAPPVDKAPAAADDEAVARWAAAAITKRRGAYLKASEAREAFEAWCATEGVEPPNPTAFGKAMRAAGFDGRKVGGTQRYEGVVLVSNRPALRVVASTPEPKPAAAADAPPPPRIMGKISQFASGHLKRSIGERISVDEAYGAYGRWCSSLGVAPVDAHRFKASLAQICDSSGVDLKEIGEMAYCIDVKLAS